MSTQVTKRKTSAPVNVWSIVGGAVLVTVAFIVAKNFPALRRYIKMERM
jgi:hypothetical protein